MRIATSVCTSRALALSSGRLIEHRVHHGAVAEDQKFDVRVAAERYVGALQDDRRAMIAAHSVKRDVGLIRHGSTLAARVGVPAN